MSMEFLDWLNNPLKEMPSQNENRSQDSDLTMENSGLTWKKIKTKKLKNGNDKTVWDTGSYLIEKVTNKNGETMKINILEEKIVTPWRD